MMVSIVNKDNQKVRDCIFYINQEINKYSKYVLTI